MSATAGAIEMERNDDGSVTLTFEQMAGPNDGLRYQVRLSREIFSDFVAEVVRFDFGSSARNDDATAELHYEINTSGHGARCHECWEPWPCSFVR